MHYQIMDENYKDSSALETYMDYIRDKALAKLDPMEVAAIFDNMTEFTYLYRMSQEESRLQDYLY